VRLTHGDISIRYEVGVTTPEIIAQTIRTLGYSVQPVQQHVATTANFDRESLIQIAIAGACAMNIMVLAVSLYQGLFTGIEARYESLFRWMSLALTIPVVAYSALPIYRKGMGALRTGTLHIDLPISIGIALSFLLSAINTVRGSGEIYFDSIATIVFLLLSTRYLQRRAFDTARRRCASQWSLLPSKVRQVLPDGSEREIPIIGLRSGMIISVKPGERLPCDGTVIEGTSSLDCSTITGESLPSHVTQDSPVLAGSLNIEAPLCVLSATNAGSSRLDRIITAVTSSISQPPRFITALDTLSMLFTATALLLAGGAFIFSLSEGLETATSHAIAMLTVTCPCAVALALPLLSIRALSAAAERGILVKSPTVFEELPKIRRIFLDKTGTLTTGSLTVTHVHRCSDRTESEIYGALATLVAIDPHHPVAKAIQAWLPPHQRSLHRVSDARRIPGRGVTARISDPATESSVTVMLCSRTHFEEITSDQAQAPLSSIGTVSDGASVIVLAFESEVARVFELTDSLRMNALPVTQQLARSATIQILSGDRAEVTCAVGRHLGLPADKATGGLLPEDKAAIISAAQTQTLYAGDGANDAPALRAATVGVALRGGIQSILESAHVFIDRGGIEKILILQSIAARYRTMARLIVGLGLTYNAVGICAAFMGYISPLVAAVAMPIFSIILLLIAYTACSGISSKE
jgi:Cu2+-exporting ATPase